MRVPDLLADLFAPAAGAPVDKIRPDSPAVRPAAEPATARVFAPFAPFAPAGLRPESPDSPEPTAHCDRCGSPSWWRSPSSPGWRCAWCAPRPPAFAGTSLVLDSGQWAPGTAPPPEPDDDAPLPPAAPRPPRPEDGRVQVAGGAWRTPAAHAAINAFYRHHWRCHTCQRAGRGYAVRCPTGERLHAACRAAVREESEPPPAPPARPVLTLKRKPK